MRTNLFTLFLLLPATGFSQDTATHQRQSNANVNGTKVAVTETYTTDSPKLLQDYLSEHAGGDNAVKIGPNQGFTFIIQAEGNRDAQINVNLYVTLEKAFVRLTREQKRALSLVTVHRDFVVRRQEGTSTFLSFNVKGVRIGDNMFVRVTKNDDYAFADDDEYFFIAPKTSVAGAMLNAARKVDPDDLVVDPGSDEELKHFGISPPTVNDYLKLGTVDDRSAPGGFPTTTQYTAVRNADVLQRNAARWEQFVDELNRKRAELGVDPKSRTLLPDLYQRYHPQQFSAREWVTPATKIGTAEYLRAEWNITAPVYLPLQRVVNAPAGYPEGYSEFANSVLSHNTAVHATNLKFWSDAWTQMVQKGMKEPAYGACYWAFLYDGTRHGVKVADVTPAHWDIDANPPARSLAQRRKHGITLPRFYNQALITGVNPHGGPVIVAYRTQYANVIIPAVGLNREMEAIDSYNRAARAHNRDEWRRFLGELRDAGIPRQHYAGHRVDGILLNDPEETDYYAERRFFYHTPGTGQRLPELDGRTFDY